MSGDQDWPHEDHPLRHFDRTCPACEIERLQQVCRNVYEVWAGSEGIPLPKYASEAYLLTIIENMRDEAKEGLK